MSKKFQAALTAYIEAKAASDAAKATLARAENCLLEHLDVPEGESGTFDFGEVKLVVPVTYKVQDIAEAEAACPFPGFLRAVLPTKVEFSKSGFNAVSQASPSQWEEWFNLHIEAKLGKPQIKVAV